MPEKKISGWLVVDWKSGSHRTRKSEPDARELSTHELLAKLSIDVRVPEVQVPELAVEIDVPEPHVHQAVLEGLDEEDLLDWTDVATEVIEADEERIAQVPLDDYETLDAIAKQFTTDTLIQLKTRPDPSAVQNYIRRVLDELAAPEGADA